MNTNRTLISVFTGVLFLSTNFYSQHKATFNPNQSEIEKRKDLLSNNITSNSFNNSFGFEYRFESMNSPNIGITYRRFSEESFFNLKMSLFVGKSKYSYSSSDILLHPTSDSTFIGISPNNMLSYNYQTLEIGIEKKNKLWKVGFVVGLDLLLGHKKAVDIGRVFDVTNHTIERNGKTYFQYNTNLNNISPLEDLNSLRTNRSYLTTGGSFKLGMLFDINQRLYASFFIGARLQAEILMNEKPHYMNKTYKEHLPIENGFNYLDLDYSASFGLHYKF